MEQQIQNFLNSNPEFSKLKDKILEDIEKKGYSIIQNISKDELEEYFTYPLDKSRQLTQKDINIYSIIILIIAVIYSAFGAALNYYGDTITFGETIKSIFHILIIVGIIKFVQFLFKLVRWCKYIYQKTHIIFEDKIFYNGKFYSGENLGQIVEKFKIIDNEFPAQVYEAKISNFREKYQFQKKNFLDYQGAFVQKNTIFYSLGTLLISILIIFLSYKILGYEFFDMHKDFTTSFWVIFTVIIGTSFIFSFYLVVSIIVGGYFLQRIYFLKYKIISKLINSYMNIFDTKNKNNIIVNIKNIEDGMLDIQNFARKSQKLQTQMDTNPYKIKDYEKDIALASQKLIQVSKNLEDLKILKTNGLEKSLLTAKNEFGKIITNWINMLNNIQTQIQDLKAENNTQDQKLFVKTTDKLNSDIGNTIKQLEVLKV